MNKFSHNTNGLQSLCFDLYVALHSNYHKAATVGDKRDKPIYDDFFTRLEPIIKSRTLDIAIHHRALDDMLGDCEPKEKIDSWVSAEPCGWFSDNEMEVDLRECSNKIIHGEEFEYTYKPYEIRDEIHNFNYLNVAEESVFNITGTKHGKRWNVVIDLMLYAEHVYQYAYYVKNEYKN